MALVSGAAGAGFSNTVAAPLPQFAPSCLQGGPQFDGSGILHNTSATADGLAEGAWDLKAWERGEGADGRAGACACVVLGAQLRAACWDDEAKEAVIVPCTALETHASESCSSQSASETGPEHLEATVAFGRDATTKRIKKWFRAESNTRQHGGLPAGVSVGQTAAAAEADDVAIVRSPLRLLGLTRAGQGPAFAWETFHAGVRRHEASEGEDRAAAFSVPLPPEMSAEEIVLEAEDLVAFLLAECRQHCSRFRGWPLSTVALAVPSWWNLCRRTAAAEACTRCGLHLCRLASRAACAAMGAFHRLATTSGELSPALIAEADAAGFTQSDGHRQQVFVIDVDADSIDVSLMQAVVDVGEGKEEERLLHGQPLSAEWFHAAATTQWETLAAAGGPRYWLGPGTTKPLPQADVSEPPCSRVFDAGCLAEGADSKKMLGLGVQCALRDCGADAATPAVILIVVSGIACELDAVVAVVRECLGQVPLLHVEGNDVACGLARLIAAEAGEIQAQGLVSEVLPAPLALITCPKGELAVAQQDESCEDDRSFGNVDGGALAARELLFDRATKLPASTTRRFSQRDAGESGNMDLIIMQGGSGGVWQMCQRIPHVLTTLDDEFEEYVCEAATWAFQLDAGGLLTVSPHEVEGGRPPSSVRREARRRWTTRVVCIIFVLLIAFSAYFNAYSAGPMSSGAGKGFRKRLASYLQKHSPGKIPEIDSWLHKYSGREDVLVKRLEKKYGARFPSATSGVEL